MISPERFLELKSKVKAECQRRNGVGTVASTYGGTDYDFSTTPKAGGQIKSEYYTKNAVPLNAISGDIDTQAGVIQDE